MTINFFKQSFIYFFSNIISRSLSILLLPLYTRILSTTDYGIFDLLIIFGNFVNVIVAFEISQSIYRFYHEKKNKKKYCSTSLWFTVFAYIIFLGLTFTFSKEITFFFFARYDQIVIFNFAVIYITLNGIYILVTNQLRLQNLANYFLKSSLISGVVTIFSTFIFVIIFKLQLIGIFLGLILGIFLGLIYSINKLMSISYVLTFNVKALIEMLKYSIPLIFSSILVISILFMDRYFLNYYLSIQEVGIYGIGYRISSVLILIIVGFQLSFSPFIFKNYKKKKTPLIIGNFLTLFFSICFLFYLFLSLFSKDIMRIFIGKDFIEAGNIISYLGLSLMISQFYVFFPGIMIAKKNYLYLIINFIGFLINFFLNIYLIPLNGIVGASIASLFTNIFILLFSIIFSQYYYTMIINWLKLIVYIFFVTTFSFFYSVINIFSLEEVYFKILLFIVAIFLIFFLKIYNNQKLKFFS